LTNSVYALDAETLTISDNSSRAAGRERAVQYQAAKPYSNICIDDFLPEAILDRVLLDLNSLTLKDAEASFDRPQEKLKSSYNPELLPIFTKNLFHAFNSRSFIIFLEELSGIKGLIPDPYFIGAGIHETSNGGHLDIHADFSLHKQLKLERRLNVLIYLNREWRAEWGGSFEIWDKQMAKKEASFIPLYNRMVCFSTASDTFHGNPNPVKHPEGKPRLSIALYYYTATWDPARKAHTTLFKARPGTADETDRLVARRAFIEDITPPIIYRRIAGGLQRLGL